MTPSQGLVLIIALILIAEFVLWRYRRRLIRDFDKPVLFRKGEVQIRDAIAGGIILAVIAQSVLGRVELDHERDRNLEIATAQLVTMDRLDDVERDLKAYARFLAPSDKDVLEIYRRYRRACAARTEAGAQCRRDFAASISRVLRVENNRILPAPPGARTAPRGDDGAVTVPRPAPPPRTVTVPGPPGKPGERGPIGPQGPPGRNVDSALVDGLENRVADVERALANVLGRLPGIDRVLALLCRPPLRICG